MSKVGTIFQLTSWYCKLGKPHSLFSADLVWGSAAVFPPPPCPDIILGNGIPSQKYLWGQRSFPLDYSDGPPVPSKQGTKVPGRLLHSSLGCRQSTASEICQSSLPNCSAVSTKYIRPSGLRCWGSDGLELTTGQSPWSIALQQQL